MQRVGKIDSDFQLWFTHSVILRKPGSCVLIEDLTITLQFWHLLSFFRKVAELTTIYWSLCQTLQIPLHFPNTAALGDGFHSTDERAEGGRG